ncbi:MAG: ABC transporter substrate-binding protein [Thermoleophilia bacterium]|nr:ABC transporter substrate-binding protein [Thermoleophilia bacterium]
MGTAVYIVLALALAVGVLGVAACDSSDSETTESTTAQTTESTTSETSASSETTATTSPITEEIYPTAEIYPSTTTTVIDKLDKLTLVAPPGPMAVPMAYIAVNDKLADVAEKTELVIWENAEQLKALVSGDQGDFVTLPSNNAAIFYNKGLKLQLLNVAVWNITYLVTTDADATGLADIKGQSLAVSLQGSVPDVMFQYLAMKEGLDPEKDFDLQYVADPTKAAQLLLAGKVKNAVLSEALATNVILKSKDSAKPLHRALAFDEAWIEATARSEDTPIAGTVATASVMDKPEVIAAFQREYVAALEWMLADREAAGKFVETELPDLGLDAAVMASSLENITWKFMPASDAMWYLNRFYGRLSELSPEVVGGKLPDDAFYYAP